MSGKAARRRRAIERAFRENEQRSQQTKAAVPAGDPDWSRPCENCGATPVVRETGLCGPCTFGEAETADGNW